MPKFLLTLSLLCGLAQAQNGSTTLDLVDPVSLRPLPLQLYHPAQPCSALRPCPVALFSGGYGIDYRAYSFVARTLTEQGYAVVAIDHATVDPKPIDFKGDVPAQMRLKWAKGVEILAFVRSQLEKRQAHWDWERLLIVGHSMGGDMAALYAQQAPVAGLITLDNRRVALPRHVKLLSLRASDTEAEPGVLPAAGEHPEACIIKLPGTRHNNMHDGGSEAERALIRLRISRWIEGACPA